MQGVRFLLPFTERIDLGALAYAVQFASSQQATLVPFALIPLSEQQWAKGPRLEATEQASDFLKAVKYQAKRAGVTVEPSVNKTCDVVRSISLFAQEFLCEGILLFLGGGTTALLPPEIVTCLLEIAPCTLYLVRLSPTFRAGLVPTLLAWCSNLISRQTDLREAFPPCQAHVVPAGEMIMLLSGCRMAPLHLQGRKRAL